MGASEAQTPWAVICPNHGQVFLDSGEYTRQMMNAHRLWACPLCNETASWDDDNYDRMMWPEDYDEQGRHKYDEKGDPR